MSAETIEDLNANTIQGYGYQPWHYREGVSPEPYSEAVPESVVEELFPLIIEVPLQHVYEGEGHEVASHKGLIRHDTEALLSVVGSSYEPHQFTPTLLGMGLPIASAGLLKGGAQAWVQYGTADVVTTPENVSFITKLLTVTAADGSMSTQFRYVSTIVVCDNTLSCAMKEGTATVQRVRHTRLSVPRVDTMRRAFGLLDDVAHDQSLAITEQIHLGLTDRQFSGFLDSLLPLTRKGSTIEGRSKTIQENKRDKIIGRYTGMWSDYEGTAFGALQAVDTAARWDFTKTDEEKVMGKTITGDFDKLQEMAWHSLMAGVKS